MQRWTEVPEARAELERHGNVMRRLGAAEPPPRGFWCECGARAACSCAANVRENRARILHEGR